MLTHLTMKSKNRKVGPIPVSTSSKATCWDGCPIYDGGCYADGGPLAMHWRAVTNGQRGMGWEEFCAMIDALPDGQLWRHNQAGDLPGEGAKIDHRKLKRLTKANANKRGFTFTHKPMTPSNRAAVAEANAAGFTINLSANTLAHADELADLGIGPVVVLLDAEEGKRHTLRTPAGRLIETCPATYLDDTTCVDCMLCARPDRKCIMGFPAHGSRAAMARAVASAAPRVTIRRVKTAA